MERKTTKMLALVAVIGLCAVALIGAAYAAFAGTASTYNEGNTATTEYVTIAGSGDIATEWAAITTGGDAVPMDAYKYHKIVETVDTDYIALSVNTTNAQSINGHSAFEIGSKIYSITNKTTETITAIDLTLTAGSDLGSKFIITAGVGSVYDDFAVTTAYSVNDPYKAEISVTGLNIAANGSADITVKLYASAGTYDVKVPDNKIGAAASGSPNNAWEVVAANIGNFKVLDDVDFAISIEDATPAQQNP